MTAVWKPQPPTSDDFIQIELPLPLYLEPKQIVPSPWKVQLKTVRFLCTTSSMIYVSIYSYHDLHFSTFDIIFTSYS